MHDVSTNRQVGIVSIGPEEDCSSAKAGANTRVTDNLDFIEEIIRKTIRTPTQTSPHHPALLS